MESDTNRSFGAAKLFGVKLLDETDPLTNAQSRYIKYIKVAKSNKHAIGRGQIR
jgi:hypothetical protein